MLKIKDLHVSVLDKNILNGVDLTVEKDKIHVIMGPNGVGKSTICKVIMGDPNYKVSGSIIYNNEDLTKLNTSEIAKRGIFYLLQNPTEIPGVTNAELLRTSLIEAGIKESVFEFNKRLTSVCEKLHIDKSFIHRNINEGMSGGEKKKNELLQLYILKPSLILLDELDSGLDVDSLGYLSEALLEYKKESKCSIIIITHHTNILRYLHPDKVHILKEGKITLEGDETLADKIENFGFKGAFNVDGTDKNE